MLGELEPWAILAPGEGARRENGWETSMRVPSPGVDRRTRGICFRRGGLDFNALLASLLLSSLIAGCASSGGGPPAAMIARLEAAGIVRPSPDCHQRQEALDLIYDQTIFDAAVFRADNEVDPLRAVTGPAILGSLISCDRCDRPSSPTCSSTCRLVPGPRVAPTDIWVSFGDQVQGFYRQFPAHEVVLRLQQLQGLPPNLFQPTESWKILVVQVDGPGQLFRPCANPNPTTAGPCTEDFPCDQTCLEHRSWTAGQAFSAWQIPDGYPWTRLGYTYNWNPSAPSIVGTSEFVIPAGTAIEVIELADATAYCSPAG